MQRISRSVIAAAVVLVLLSPSRGQSPPAPSDEKDRTTIPLEYNVQAVALSDDGATLACGGYDRVLQVFDARTGRRLFRSEKLEAPVTAIAMSPDGDRIVTAGAENVPLFWPPVAAAERTESPRPGGGLGGGGLGGGISPLARNYFPDPASQQPIIGGNFSTPSGPIVGIVSLWDLKSPDRSRTLRRGDLPILAVAFAGGPDRVRVLDADLAMASLSLDPAPTASREAKRSNEAGGARPADRPMIRPMGFQGPATSFSADGSRCAVLTSWPNRGPIPDTSKDVRVVDVGPGPAFARALALSPDGRRFVTANGDGSLALWGFDRAKIEEVVRDAEPEPRHVHFAAFPSGSSLLLTVDVNQTVRLRDLDAGRTVFLAKGPAWGVRAASLDGTTLTVVSGGVPSSIPPPGNATPLVVQRFDVGSIPAKR
jgi:WD40 repeat protein